ncbi:Dual specificity catalytic domain [Cordyceps militaris]|uniref:protein-tyrosine-phosphatase n=1 Tax=Cordyceps militaris TaxID=73501 RepID=A0A2H4SBQ4_CORMI|nr:Dual specificity catalytic domain [Cordyceps militaris]
MASSDRSTTTPDTPPSAPTAYSCPISITEIQPHLYLGNLFSSLRSAVLEANRITAVIHLMDGRCQWMKPSIVKIVPEANHLYIPCLDSATMDLLPFMARVCDFIEEHARSSPGGGGGVLVHCHQGVSRSASMVIAYIMRKQRISVDDTLAAVKAKRRVRPNPNFMEQLRVWDAVGYQIWQDSAGTIPKPEYQAFLDKRAIVLRSLGLTGDEPIGIQNL